SNIISNSVKYNDNSEKIIHISLSVSGRFLKVMITDNGIGLDKKDMKMLFTEFFKADPSRHQKGSSGLGLSICRRLIELHGGKIKAESKGIDKGLKITFTLPVNKK
ncbi:MAG: sensor histidine kinase, partial [Candidatus Woesearchaeota archaeon]